MTRMTSRACRAAFGLVAAGLLLLPHQPAEASGIGMTGLTIDFTNPDEARALARWSLPDKIYCHEDGLGWNGPARSSYEASIHVTKPLAIGYTWWAATNANVHVKAAWTGTETDKIRGHLYVRHSPDAEHWTPWIRTQPADWTGKARPHEFRLQMNVPRAKVQVWREMVRRYLATKPEPRARTEARAASWADSDPLHAGYVAREKPFFGYMQVLYDVDMPGGHNLRRLEIQVSFVTPGSAHPPKVAGADDQKLREQPWNHGRLRRRERDVREVLVAALRRFVDDAKGGGIDQKTAKGGFTLCDQTGIGPDVDLLSLRDNAPYGPPPFDPEDWQLGRAWKHRNSEPRLLPSGLRVGVRIRYRQRDHAAYLIRNGQSEGEDSQRVWQRFYARDAGSLGLVMVSEPAFSASEAVVLVTRIHAPKKAVGIWYRLEKLRIDRAWTWRVLETHASPFMWQR